MAKRIFNKLWEAVRPKSLEEHLINSSTKALKKYCKNQGYAFIPLYLQDGDLPEFAEDVNRIIKEHARKDLPDAQFQGHRDLKLEELIEIGGILGYNREVFEINYSQPDPNNVRYSGRSITSSTGNEPIPLDSLNLAGIVIDWHSHPISTFNIVGNPSKGDMDHASEMQSIIGEKQFYMVVFSPAVSKSFWYKIEPV